MRREVGEEVRRLLPPICVCDSKRDLKETHKEIQRHFLLKKNTQKREEKQFAYSHNQKKAKRRSKRNKGKKWRERGRGREREVPTKRECGNV